MVTLRNALTRGLGVGLVAGVCFFGCQGPEEFLRGGGDDADSSGLGGSPPGTGGDFGSGGETGSGGIEATGGITGAGGRATGGITGAGGRATGGFTGTGGRATGGFTGTGGLTGSGGRATGGITGAAGGRGSGGITGAAGRRGTGGITGAAGQRGTGGLTGSGGRATGGMTGTAGSRGTAGSTGTGPCAGLCDSPTKFTSENYNSGNVGSGAVCFETTASIQGGNCSQVPAPRTFSVNGKVETCGGADWPSLPAKLDGGYCFQFSAGTPDYSSFATF
jgi:hypothetical protein